MSVSIQELDAQQFWQDALRGKPLMSLAGHFTGPSFGTRSVALNDPTNWWVKLPDRLPKSAPDVQRMVHQLRQWTGWSARTLADALSTTHTTVLSIENGRPLFVTRSGDLRRRITDAHDLVARLTLLVNHDRGRAAAVLMEQAADGLSALDQLHAGQPSRAYLAIIDVVRGAPERSRNSLLIGSRPAQPGGATEPLLD